MTHAKHIVLISKDFPFWLLGLDWQRVSTIFVQGYQDVEELLTAFRNETYQKSLLDQIITRIGPNKLRYVVSLDASETQDEICLVSDTIDSLEAWYG